MEGRWFLRGVVLIAAVILLAATEPMPGHAQGTDDLAALDKQVVQLYRAGKYAEAMELAKRSLALAEQKFGPDRVEVCPPLNNLAALYNRTGRYAEAESLYKRSLAVREKALPVDHPDVGLSVNNLAAVYFDQGRYAEAEPLYKRGLAIREKAHGPNHAQVGESLNNLAALYEAQGRYAEAEPLHQRALAVREKVLGPEHPVVATSLNNLALLYKAQGRYAEAESLYKRSLAIREKALGPDHPDIGLALNNLGSLYRAQGRYAEAVQLHKRALVIREKALGPDHRSVGTSLNNLAELYREQGHYAEAEPLHKRALLIREKALGADHHEVGASLNNLALLHSAHGRFAEAEPLYQRALAINEKALGPDHPDVALLLSNLAALYFAQHDWARAAEYWRRSTAVRVRRTQRGTPDVGQPETGKRKSEAEQSRGEFVGLIKAGHRLMLKGGEADAALLREMFQAAQWAEGSEAAASLVQMAARGAKGDAALAVLVRERQDLVEEWQKRDGIRIAAVAREPDRRDRANEAANVQRIAAIDTRIAAIDARLATAFPDYAALARPKPLSVEEVQAQLAGDEALVLFFDTPEVQPTPGETFVWVVTKTDVRWVRSDIGTPALTREVAALRCGLAYTGWYAGGSERCGKLLGVAPRKGDLLPFDHARAHKLYSALFGEVQDLIRGKHLLIVPSGPLTQLPFQVLVTAAPPQGRPDHRIVTWLARSHAVTVLPAVSSLQALRRVARPSAATRPIIGFGNPLLDGPDQRHAHRATLARENQRCSANTGPQQVAALSDLRASVVPIATHNGLANVAHLKMQTPLPETIDELCAVARDLKADVSEVRLGARATEREIKSLSETGVLARYKIVHFATHGALAGQLSPTSEPGLILTPPNVPTEQDDGYLSASEIAGLKLDADWVILSACNTAAGNATGAEALSGLARAFFYAQARALLVSHWEVNSAAAVKLIVSAVGTLSSNPKIGRAEALRGAMLALIDKGEPHEAHPAFWAPFVVVGEGAPAR